MSGRTPELSPPAVMQPRDQVCAAVSVIVPVRNEAPTMNEFLASICHQDLSPDEIVLCDGGSTDETVAIIQRHQTTEPRLRLVRDGDANPGRARNIAITAAKHEWIAMTDAGTIVPPSWLRALVDRRDASPGVEVVFGSYEPIVGGSFVKQAASLVCVAPRRRATTGPGYLRAPTTASIMTTRALWRKLGGFPEDVRAAEDLLFFRRISQRAAATVDAPDAVVLWRMPDTSGGLFSRFRTFSRHTLRAGLGHGWHRTVAGMYACCAAAAVLGIFHSLWWLTVIPAALCARIVRSIHARRGPHADTPRLSARLLLGAGFITLLVDAAMWAGVLDYVRHDYRR